MSITNSTSQKFRPQTGIVGQTGLSSGTDEPVVMLHGWGGFKEMWWGTMRALSPSYRVLVVDWPGHGSSPPLERGQPVLDALADLAVASCAALGLQRITLVGHSLGGNIASRVSLARADFVARPAFIDAVIRAEHSSARS